MTTTETAQIVAERASAAQRFAAQAEANRSAQFDYGYALGERWVRTGASRDEVEDLIDIATHNLWLTYELGEGHSLRRLVEEVGDIGADDLATLSSADPFSSGIVAGALDEFGAVQNAC